MKDLSGLVVAEEEFPKLLNLCGSDRAFPTSWPRWQALLEDADRLAKEAGKSFNRVEVRVGAFKLWCSTVGIVPGVDALRAYAIVQRIKAEEALAELESRGLTEKDQADLFAQEALANGGTAANDRRAP